MYTIRYTFLFSSLHFCFSIAGGIEISAYHDIKLRARGHNSEVFTKSQFLIIVQLCSYQFVSSFRPQFKIDAGTIRLPRLTEWKASKHKVKLLKILLHGISHPVCLREKLKLTHRQLQLPHKATRPSTSSVFVGNQIQEVVLSKQEQKN